MALAVVGVSLWLPYVVHAVRALDELPDDITIGLNHWPVQVSAGIVVMLACLVAANLDAATATEGGPWGIGCVLWGTVLAAGHPAVHESVC